MVRKYKLSQRFVDMAYGVFKQLDLDRNGVIDIGWVLYFSGVVVTA